MLKSQLHENINIFKCYQTLYQLCVFSLATVVRAVNFGNWRNLKMIGYVLAPGA